MKKKEYIAWITPQRIRLIFRYAPKFEQHAHWFNLFSANVGAQARAFSHVACSALFGLGGSFFAAGHRIARDLRDDDRVSVGISERELSPVVEIHFRSPVDLDLVFDARMKSRGI